MTPMGNFVSLSGAENGRDLFGKREILYRSTDAINRAIDVNISPDIHLMMNRQFLAV